MLKFGKKKIRRQKVNILNANGNASIVFLWLSSVSRQSVLRPRQGCEQITVTQTAATVPQVCGWTKNPPTLDFGFVF